MSDRGTLDYDLKISYKLPPDILFLTQACLKKQKNYNRSVSKRLIYPHIKDRNSCEHILLAVKNLQEKYITYYLKKDCLL